MDRLGQDSLTTAAIAFASRTSAGDVKGTGVLVGGAPRAIRALVVVGTMAANITVDCKAQQSDTDVDGNYADITGAAIVQIAAADKVAALDIRATKKYVRLVVTLGGAGIAGGVICGAIWDRYRPDAVPTTNSPAAVVV